MTVYDPAKDSYLLNEVISGLVLEGKKTLDMGTGSGIIAEEMAEQGAEVTAADINPEALEETERKAGEKELDIRTVKSNLFEDINGQFDVIAFNPPYLPGEEGVGDEEIWRGGEKGTEVVEEFLEQVDEHMRDGGAAFMVLSSRSEYGELVDRFELEIVESEKLWFEELFVAKYE